MADAFCATDVDSCVSAAVARVVSLSDTELAAENASAASMPPTRMSTSTTATNTAMPTGLLLPIPDILLLHMHMCVRAFRESGG